MEYYVYENWRVRLDKAVVHRSDCGHCNGGAGTNKPKEQGRNGVWHGPFATYQAALQFAHSTGRPDVRPCRKCRPDNRGATLAQS